MLTIVATIGTYAAAAWGYAAVAWLLGAPLGVVLLVYVVAKGLGK